MDQNGMTKYTDLEEQQNALFGFWVNMSSHPERSPLNYSSGYASAGDRPACFDILTQQPKPGENYGLMGEI